jgi:hypothetical protein
MAVAGPHMCVGAVIASLAALTAVLIRIAALKTLAASTALGYPI